MVTYYISKLIKKLHIPAVKNSKIDKTARVCPGAHIVNTNLDKYSYVGNYSTVLYCEIGKFCSIADNCKIGGAAHPMDWVSTSPVFHAGHNILGINFSSHHFDAFTKTYIGNDVWIGNNCLIKAGITIGDGAIIGMGSVVMKNVGSYEVWAGNPAKLIRRRFSEDIIESLLSIKWWNYDDETLKTQSESFSEVNIFISNIMDKKS